MLSLKAAFQWLSQDVRDLPIRNRARTEHTISLERLTELIEASGEAPRLLAELRREKQRLDEQDFESRIW
jgi:hypothetical protein